VLEYLVSILKHPLVFAGGVAVGTLGGYRIKAWLVKRAAQVEALAQRAASKV